MLESNRERRIYDDETAYADRASWLDAHQIKQDRRKPVNIANTKNDSLYAELCALCLSAGECTCEQVGR